MFEQTFKNIDDVLWKEAGCTTELDYTEQTSWLLFLKYPDDLEQERKVETWTSAFTLAEVWKRKCDGVQVGLAEKDDQRFENFIEKETITKVQAGNDVGTLARKLLRKFPGLGKPQDAIHVASCLLSNIDELHTFDIGNLLRFDGRFPRMDKKKLAICEPPKPPKNPQSEMELNDGKQD